MGHIAELPSDGPHQHRLRDAFEREEKRYNKLKRAYQMEHKKKEKKLRHRPKGYHERHQKESSAIWQHALYVNSVQ